MSESLIAYTVGQYGLEIDDYDQADPRGQLLVWEPPQPWADYVVGVDPTMGIIGWNRRMRSNDEEKHDNAAIEVFRVGGWQKGQKQPDVQVAEWAGPLDAEDLAPLCNFVGRLFGGSHEDKQALMAIEIYPGPGWLTQRELHDRFGYERFPPWLVTGKRMIQVDTGRMGWVSNASTRRDLWIRGAGHLKRFKAIINSPHLVEEMVDCKPDNFLSINSAAGRAGYGCNDDRVVAALIALWFCNEWQIGQEPTEPTGPAKSDVVDWQLTATSYEDMLTAWNERVAEMQD